MRSTTGKVLVQSIGPMDQFGSSRHRSGIARVNARTARPRTRIQSEKRESILQAALDIFSANGFRGSTIDQIAEACGMSKPNLLYYFPSKEDIHKTLLDRLLHIWLEPLLEIDPAGEPLNELRNYIRRKLTMSRELPRESRLFANEILQGAPHAKPVLAGELRQLVDEKAKVIANWMQDGRLAKADPYHLIFAIWATTQHYADFDVQVRAVLGSGRDGENRFEEASRFLEMLFLDGLKPRD